MNRAVVSVATTPHTQRGQQRLERAVHEFGCGARFEQWSTLPASWPTHERKPYAFKAFALEYVSRGADVLLWCDACILPVRSMEPVWRKIEADGYLLMNNGHSNYTWTADSAYADLFPTFNPQAPETRQVNRSIPHTVGGFFGISMHHEIGNRFMSALFRVARQTNAFCGPWANSNCPEQAHIPGAAPCGPPDVRGHRHDQSAMSVIAWRLGLKLTDAPNYFIYGKAEDAQDPRTVVVADGSYA